ncbi:MAG: hypothetical protein WC775_01800 [Patescibacteria group bacterium]|jgi:hypothetical protein
MSKLHIAVICVRYRNPQSLVDKLKAEFTNNRLVFDFYCIDNTYNNRGFAGGVNTGMRQALKKYFDLIIVCNLDIHSLNCSEKSLISAIKSYDIFGGVMIQQKRRYYGGVIDYWSMAGGLQESTRVQKHVSCDFVSGSFMCITRKAFDTIGYLPEKYFMYYEDVDYCTTAIQMGLKVGISTNISYEHEETSRTSDKKSYYLAYNRLRFLFSQGSLVKKVRELLRTPFVIVKLMRSATPANSLQLEAYKDFIHGKKISHKL